jgi:hypothetical protein
MSFLIIPIAFLTAIPTAAQTSKHPQQYHAYGDSITAGHTLTDPATQEFPAVVGAYEGVPFEDYAVGSSEACDLPVNQIFAHEDSPSLASYSIYSVLIGSPDVIFRGDGAHELVFMMCHKAILSWLAVPKEYKVLATSSAVTTTGPGSIDTKDNWNAWTTEGLGSTVSFPITTTVSGPIYLWPLISSVNPTTYTYSLDGLVVGTETTQWTVSTALGNTTSLGFIRLGAVPPGKHVVKVTQTSSGTVSVVGIGTTRGTASGTMPTVLVGTLTYQRDTAGCTIASYEPCLNYTLDVEADMNIFLIDGLDLRLFDTRNYMFATAPEMDDDYHPSALGQIEIGHSIEAIYANRLGQITSPAPNATLTENETFTWSPAPGISYYDLHLSTVGPGGADLFASGTVRGNSVTVNGIPAHATIYAKLYSWVNGAAASWGDWEGVDYTYTTQ